MGTKNKPGAFDCYANAEPDEPMFVLLGRDTAAPLAITMWRAIKERLRARGESDISKEKLEEATTCALAMNDWAISKGKNPRLAMNTARSVILQAKYDPKSRLFII